MSELATYLKQNGIRQADFAESVGMTQGTISKLCSRKIGISLDQALKIEQATGGVVPVAALARSADHPEEAGAA